jgi:hypothetical protein
MIKLVIGILGILFVIVSAVLPGTSIYFNDKALIFVVGIAFFLYFSYRW